MSDKNNDTTSSTPKSSVIFAAGGLIWRKTTNGRELLLVFRKRYKDWTLPKGKLKAEDKDLVETARREVKEETGYDVEISGFAGCTCYTHDSHPKVVTFWNMSPVGEAEFEPSEEVEKSEWLSIHEALCRLSHENERDLLSRNTGAPLKDRRCSCWSRLLNFIRSYDIRLNRLRASLGAYRFQLESRVQRINSSDDRKLAKGYDALRLLDMAEKKLELGPRTLSEGWRYFTESYRLGLHLCNANELEAEATALRNELPKKLGKSWRCDAALSLLKCKSEGNRQPSVEQLIKTLEIRDEHFANTYFKIDLVCRQLTWLAVVLFVILSLIFCWILRFFEGGFPSVAMNDCRIQNLGLVFLFGMLGGTMTTCLSIVRSPASKSPIPEQLLSFFITLARPLIGGAAAIIVILALHAKVLPVVFEGNSGAGLLLLAFAGGFSEQLIMGALGKVAKDK